MPNFDKDFILGIIERLKIFLKCRTDAELATKLGVALQTVSAWKYRGTIDWYLIINIPGIDLNYIVLNQKPAQNTVKESTPTYSTATNCSSSENSEILALKAKNDLLMQLLKEKEREYLELFASSSGRQSSRAEHIQSNIRK